MFIDSHAHLEMPQFDLDRRDMIQRAIDAGVQTILNIGSAEPGTDSLQKAFDLVERYDILYMTIGVHPHEARQVTEAYYESLVAASSHPKVIAWGEVGLDYHYDHSPRQIQRDVFRRQLQSARRVNRPVIVHTRAADDDTAAILREEWGQGALRGILHCFSGGEALAQAALAMGFLVSFSGIITFKGAHDLREVAGKIPLDRVLIETDSPYLAPVPYRGRRNEPAFVLEVAKTLAHIHNVAVEEIARHTRLNFQRFFQLS
ncbi:MAG: TatD family hydrolase [Acidobacteria bacterium]|nr:TatD family hydrolase [Acidobacteriota bacterium]MBI3658469.1 TatD family hydrolase [Acidobacteriota bacterium]